MLESLDAAAVRHWCASGLASLRRHQQEINDLNVFPVPDGDTGTNLVLTLASAERALTEVATGAVATHRDALRSLARGALLGARGNSGVIVSQVFQGLADTLSGIIDVRGRALAEALEVAAAAAYEAVAEPVEGTVLTVAAAAARGAAEANSDDLATVARAATAEAARALAATPQQLPALARAGVVDAGGRGLVVLLESLVEVLVAGPTDGGGGTPGGDSAPGDSAPGGDSAPADPRSGPGVVGTARPDPADHAPFEVERETGSPRYAYEVQYLLDTTADAVTRLKATLAEFGDSLVVVGSGAPADQIGTWNVHVHVNDVGAAVEAGIQAGRPHRISVTRFADQRADLPDGGVDPDARAVVVVAPGGGLAELFRAEGATVVGAKPSTEEILAAIRATRAGRVVVLPNDPDTRAVATVAVGEAQGEGVRARVVPTRSPVQALAALAVRDRTRRFNDDVIAMAEAAGACRYGEVCYAAREALTVAGRCRPGDVLGLVDGEVNVIGVDLQPTSQELLDRMLGGGGELVTLVLGAEAPPGLDVRLRAHLSASWPFVEVQCYDGGQPHYPLLVGVE